MLNPYHEEIREIAILFAHSGAREERGNRAYAVAAAILRPDGPERKFSSLINYAHFTAMDRSRSNLSRPELATAPEAPEVLKELQTFLGDAPVVLVLPQRDSFLTLKRFCGPRRIVDLGFAAEFFLPGLDSLSPKYLWERLHRRSRPKVSFSAGEGVELAVDLIRHLCRYQLNDRESPRAAALRYYLVKSDTLFGTVFLHCAQRLTDYFGDLISIRQDNDTAAWRPFLPDASKAHRRAVAATASFQPVDPQGMAAIFRGMAGKIKNFVYRPSQAAYAGQVAAALNDAAVLTIEAGTGTGKTQGYLLPLFEFLDRNPEARAVVSTYTKSLQNQIREREIGFITKAIKAYTEIPVTLLKGKSNYLCAEKLDHVYEEVWRGAELMAWLYCLNLLFHFREADGDRIGGRIRHFLDHRGFLTKLHREVSARSGCHGRHRQCPAQIITAEAVKARLVITNHHKLALLAHDPVLSKLFRIFVIDEANHFEDACRSASALEIDSRDIALAVDYIATAAAKLQDRAAGDMGEEIGAILAATEDLHVAIDGFGRALRKIKADCGNIAAAGTCPLPAADAAYLDGHIHTHLRLLREILLMIHDHLAWLKDDDICRLLKIPSRTRERLKNARGEVADQADRWLEMDNMITRPDRTTAFTILVRHWTIAAAPIDVSDPIRRDFYGDTKGLIYTAATIRHGGSFRDFKKIVGLDRPFPLDEKGEIWREFRFAAIPSPFSGANREVLLHPDAVNGRYENKEQWLDAVAKVLPGLIQRHHGGTLVLFASYNDLEAVAARIGTEIEALGFPLLVQRRGAPTADLCDEFREIRESVLFGVDSFWYGVDFRGDTLTQVVITRLPLASPADPLQIARRRTMTLGEYQRRYNYDAAIKMNQGMGRLIRSETDYGRIVILDSRWRHQGVAGD